MQLTKEQIQQIDLRLNKGGVKYWDLRIEMIDHIVSDIEKNATTDNFTEELNKSLIRIGWFNNLKNLNQNLLKGVNIKFRTKFNKNFISFFKSSKNVLILIVFCALHFLASKTIGFKSFERINLFLFALPLVSYLFFLIKIKKRLKGKSANLLYGTFYLTMPFLVLNIFPQLLRSLPEDDKILMWQLLIPIHLIASYSGYIVCKSAIFKIENIKKELTL